MGPRIAATAAAALCVTAATAQSSGNAPAPPCASPEHRQFDFWLGRWEVFTPDGKKAGENVIEAIDGGCALLERWRGAGGFTGTSLNGWDGAARRWRQHWVDSQGGGLRLEGGLDKGRMVMRGEDPSPSKAGVAAQDRITWTPQTDGAVRQLWERSEDGGSTWAVVFDGRYVRAR